MVGMLPLLALLAGGAHCVDAPIDRESLGLLHSSPSSSHGLDRPSYYPTGDDDDDDDRFAENGFVMFDDRSGYGVILDGSEGEYIEVKGDPKDGACFRVSGDGFELKDEVAALWEGSGFYYQGVISQITNESYYKIDFYDGDVAQVREDQMVHKYDVIPQCQSLLSLHPNGDVPLYDDNEEVFLLEDVNGEAIRCAKIWSRSHTFDGKVKYSLQFSGSDYGSEFFPEVLITRSGGYKFRKSVSLGICLTVMVYALGYLIYENKNFKSIYILLPTFVVSTALPYIRTYARLHLFRAKSLVDDFELKMQMSMVWLTALGVWFLLYIILWMGEKVSSLYLSPVL